MIRTLLSAGLLLLCCACSHAPVPSPKEEDAAIAKLSRADADSRLRGTLEELKGVDEKIRTAQTRRDNYESQSSTDVTKESAVEGSEAELETLQTKRGALLHRQHVIEARLRELGAGEEGTEDEKDEKGNRPY